MLVEVCCGGYVDCLRAYRGGAKRVELNTALALGGLTANVTDLKLAKKNTPLEVICMVRCRAAGFCYNDDEVSAMFEAAKDLLEAGADGIAFGFLKEDRSVDEVLTRKMVELVHRYGKCAVFHRAFDCVVDVHGAMECLLACGCDRVLTSGLKKTAIEGARCIGELVSLYGDQIEILAGCGIRPDNVMELVYTSHVKQVHASCMEFEHDVTTYGNEVNYAYL